ncbi:MAG: TetR/AcrR family transcriptional regulator [Sphingomonadales bacterium]|nr:TetR/AcrR family transcriptional regulator [Sphingomonadales bacterium]
MGARSATKTKPGRPLKPLITREAAVKAAIDLLDREGIDALSVQAVARAMSVTAPSLYYHFKDKDELLQLVARTLLREVGQNVELGTGWKERAIALAVATRRMILRHPEAAPLMLRYFPRSLMLGAYESTLSECPYPPRHQVAILEALEKLTYGASLFAAAAEAHHVPAMPAFDTGRYPRLAAALQAGPSDEALFVETIELLFDGFAARYGSEGTGS